MPVTSGTIQFLSFKELPKPDDYDNLYRMSLKLNDEWYSMGNSKKAEWFAKHGDGTAAIGVGTEMSFPYTQNGDFKNVKRGQIQFDKIVAPTEAAPTVLQRDGAKPKQGNYHNPAEIGQIMNLAVTEYGGVSVAVKAITSEFVMSYYELRGKVEELLNTKTVEKPVVLKGAEVKDPVPTLEDFDDDIPF